MAEARIVVSGGRGHAGSPSNWKLLEELAEAFGGQAALGASRAVVDAGWRPHGEQVGQTGKVVSPEPVFRHRHQRGDPAPRRDAHGRSVIVAINRDTEAPIFRVANYGIVGDAFEVVPELTEAIKQVKSQ